MPNRTNSLTNHNKSKKRHGLLRVLFSNLYSNDTGDTSNSNLIDKSGGKRKKYQTHSDEVVVDLMSAVF